MKILYHTPHPMLIICGSYDINSNYAELNAHSFIMLETREMLIVPANAAIDGPTTVILTDMTDQLELSTDMILFYEGQMETPLRKIWVQTSELKSIAELPTSSIITNIKIWSDNKVQPSRVTIYAYI